MQATDPGHGILSPVALSNSYGCNAGWQRLKIVLYAGKLSRRLACCMGPQVSR